MKVQVARADLYTKQLDYKLVRPEPAPSVSVWPAKPAKNTKEEKKRKRKNH